MERIARLRSLLGLGSTQAVLVSKPSNMYYLTGYRGEGWVLIKAQDAYVITDFRYVEQAQREAPGLSVLEIGKGRDHLALAAEAVKDCEQVYLETDDVTVDVLARIRSLMPGKTFPSLNQAPETLREIKDDAEIALVRRACAISSQAFDYIVSVIEPGMTEKEIRLKLEYRMLELGAEALAFDTIVASGENGSLPHAVPSERKVQKGDMITLDYGAKVGGYCADMTRTVALGRPKEDMRRIYDIVLDAQLASQEALAPGRVCADIDSIARDRIAAAGFGQYFGHGLGHSLGIDIHENPRVSQACKETLKPGHLVTVEPGIYVPGLGGVRIENTCLITENGYEALVTAPRELLIL